MIYAEIVVNVPTRQSFSRRHTDPQAEPPPEDLSELPPLEVLSEDDLFAGASGTSGAPVSIYQKKPPAQVESHRGLSTFHYHLPPELEPLLQPGHLVWVPFGHQEVQGIVIRISTDAPMTTKPIKRLARPEPILTEAQLDLATWIAEYYIASFVEALRLFLPPGLLSKRNNATGRQARAKREIQVALAVDAKTVTDRLPTLGRDTQQATILAWFLAHPQEQPTVTDLRIVCNLRSATAIKTLEEKGVIAQVQETDDAILEHKRVNRQLRHKEKTVRLLQPTPEARETLLSLRGADKYQPVLAALLAADGPLWKSELYARVSTDLATLRTLQSAGLIELTERVRFRDPLAGRTYAQTAPPPLTSDQQAVWMQIDQCFIDDRHHAAKFLLHGVTGSGKTEIYLHSIERTLAEGNQAIVLVPEIALTPQTVARFAGRFPGRVTVIHSELNQGERYDVWRHIRDGEFDVVIGPRSALFAPLPRLGLVIIDEEHEGSYKQDTEAWGSFTVFYDARVVAHRLAEQTKSVLILGSATPSVDAYSAATSHTSTSHTGTSSTSAPEQAQGKEFTLLEMPRRVMGHRAIDSAINNIDDRVIDNRALTTGTSDAQTGMPEQEASPPVAPVQFETLYAEMPVVELVDMRQELRAGNRSIFSRSLQSELHATLDAGEQAILFLNRRGTRTFVICRDCGHVVACKNCDVPLTYHERASVLVCHHCNQREEIPTTCPECESKRIKYFGSGTQRIEEFVSQIAPRARLLRWDADTTRRKGSHEQLLQRFANREADVLVGTQMIAKGLDLPMVTLVGVISADTGLYLPDFRSGERTFQLLTQVAGRAGRSELGGRVVVQTYTPEHYAIQAAAQHDYAAFFQREIVFRREHGYPPIQRLVRLVYWDKKLEKAQEATEQMTAMLRYRIQELGALGERTDILGPAPAFFARFRTYYRWQILLRGPEPAAILRGLPIPFGWRVDVDPVTML